MPCSGFFFFFGLKIDNIKYPKEKLKKERNSLLVTNENP
jgi:hypothetical protein